MSDVLSSNIQFIKGVGPKFAQLLAKKGIDTVEDALYFLPRTYEDRRKITPLKDIQPNTSVTLLGTVESCREIKMGRRSRFEAWFKDQTGRVLLTWFHAFPSLRADFAEGNHLVVFGEVKFFKGGLQISHPEYEKVEMAESGKPKASLNFGRIVPVYSETEGLHQKTIRRLMREVVSASMNSMVEPFSEELLTKLSLPNIKNSFVSVHFPDTLPKEDELNDAIQRIIFEEFFVLQLGLGLKKQNQQKLKAPVLSDQSGVLEKFIKALPFKLTDDQMKAISSIQTDLKKGLVSTRLVQGDVGSGKTVVALAAAAIAADSGFQSAIMAPTELLAQQHFRTAERVYEALGIKVGLLTQSTAKEKTLLEEIRLSKIKLVIGTHALFQQRVEFEQLGLVIVDEQHRFGVEQRTELMKKGQGTHLLMMTATPIPRSLALTLYGDLDLTLIRQKPANRIPVTTSILRDRERPRLYNRIRERLQKNEQVYIIYPLVEASEKLELKSATEMFDQLKKEIFPGVSIALLHGRLKSEEKDQILLDFKEKKFQILVATTVIEVGIDVANATLMVIEHPERLGLSQLHQLRGRVGRGSLKSECILVADQFVTERLRIMERTEDGFEIAEEDLRIRGPGEFLGTRQSGLPGFRVGHILRDADLLVKAREEAESILVADPTLADPKNQMIRNMVEKRWKAKIDRLRSG